MTAKPKTIFITGITSGIGRVLLDQCLTAGFSVTALLRKEEQKNAFENIKNLELCVADLSKAAEVDVLCQILKEKEFDYVVLNAGYADHVKLFHQLPAHSIDITMQANVTSNMHITHALLPKALPNKTKFIFTSSLAARLPAKNFNSYATSKAALSKFANSLRREYPHLEILTVEIGAVNTPLHIKSQNTEAHPESFKTADEIGKNFFQAMQNKTGVVTLYWKWSVLRKVAMCAEELLTGLMVKKEKR